MAKTATSILAEDMGGSFSTYDTASVSSQSGSMYILTVATKINLTNPNQPTVTGWGATWNVVNTRLNTTAQDSRITMFQTAGNGTAGAITIAFGGQSQEAGVLLLDKLTGILVTGTGGEDGIVQSDSAASSNGGTSVSVTLGAFADTKNVTYGACGGVGGGAINEGSGFTEISEDQGGSAQTRVQSQWKDANDTGVDWTFDAGEVTMGIAVELQYKPFAGRIIIL